MGEVKHECEHGQLARVCNICSYESDIADLTAERDALKAELKESAVALESARAEVAKLKAACAAKDAALRDLIVLADSAMADANKDCGEYDRVGELREARAALATDAGRNWIDATGAVEAGITFLGGGQGVPGCYVASAFIPTEWAGFKIVVAKVGP